MRWQPSTLIGAAVAILIATPMGAASVRTTPQPAQPTQQQVTLLTKAPDAAPEAPVAPPPQNPAQPVTAFDGLPARAHTAATESAEAGANISVTVLDRRTGQLISDGNQAPYPIASVSKLFIADDVLFHIANDKSVFSPEVRQQLAVMLESSDDNAANNFWNSNGGSAIITRVAARYGLTSTTTPYDGNWWNTMSTTTDLVRYYSMLLDGTGGLPALQANIIISDLARSTPRGIDGYPQRFGIPEGLFAEPVAVKQGWMCCWNGGNWLHLSTGIIGADRRFIVALASLQPVGDAAARNTMTKVMTTLFPAGHI